MIQSDIDSAQQSSIIQEKSSEDIALKQQNTQQSFKQTDSLSQQVSNHLKNQRGFSFSLVQSIQSIELNEKCQILIVDDDMFNLKILHDMMQIQFQVQTIKASSGSIAVETIREKIALDKKNLAGKNS